MIIALGTMEKWKICFNIFKMDIAEKEDFDDELTARIGNQNDVKTAWWGPDPF